MKFKSAVYTTVSGSVGGLTYSRNKGGMYTRARAVPINRDTEWQTAVRTAMRTLSTRWRDVLTEDQRTYWDIYAVGTPIPNAFGDPKVIPALAMYVRCNAPRMQLGAAIVDDGPTEFGLPTGTPIVPTISTPNNVSIAFTNTDAWAGEVGGYCSIFASRPQSPATMFFKGPYRYMDRIAGLVVPPTSPVVMTLPFACGAGSKCFFQFRFLRADARISSPFRVGKAGHA